MSQDQIHPPRPPAALQCMIPAGARGADAAVLDGCSVLWPGAVAFTATGSLSAALAVAVAACTARFLWVGGVRASIDRMRFAANQALARGDDRRARHLLERLWISQAAGMKPSRGRNVDADRLRYATSLNRVGEHRSAALLLLEPRMSTWKERPELHGGLEQLSRCLAERLVEGRRPRLARRMLELSLNCEQWRSRIPGLDQRQAAREAGYIWLRLGDGEEAAACFLRAMQPARARRGKGSIHADTMEAATDDTGPYRTCIDRGSNGALQDDSPALGLAEAYLLSGDHRAALAEFALLTRNTRAEQHLDSPLARGRAERGRARALVLSGEIHEAIDAYDEALRWDLRGDLSAGAAVVDCLERARLLYELDDDDAATSMLDTARVLAVGREQRAMIRAFTQGQPFSWAQTRWSDVPSLPREATSRRRAARERRLLARGNGAESNESLTAKVP